MTAGRERAARAVVARRGKLGMTQQELAGMAGVDLKTIGNLESRGRWPIARTRARIESALGWPDGEMERLAAQGEEPSVPPEVVAALRRAYRDDPAMFGEAVGALEAIERERRAGGPSPREQRAG
jgi:transcriptional regulator with XRE-family HTH domain